MRWSLVLGGLVALATAATVVVFVVTPGAVGATGRRLENAYLAADLNPNGSMTVLDKQSGVSYPNLNRLLRRSRRRSAVECATR